MPRATPELLCRELLGSCCAESYVLRVYRADTCAMLRNSVSCRTCGFRYGFRFHSNRESFKISSAAGRRPAGGWIVKRFLPKSCPGDRFPARKHCCVALRTLHVDPDRGSICLAIKLIREPPASTHSQNFTLPFEVIYILTARRPHPAVPGEHATCSSIDSMIMTYVSLQH